MPDQAPLEAKAAVPLHDGLAGLAERYDGFIVDLWGVLHDGVTAFPEAVACLEQVKVRGKGIWILSNAPRRAQSVAERNAALGIPAALADGVMSSGEEAWRHLRERPDAWYRALGGRCYHLGPARDEGMRAGLDYDFVGTLAEADFLLNTGALAAEDGIETYDALLHEALARRLPIVCANPDLEVVRGGRREICAGAIALAYEELGGALRYHGKPHRETYETCLALMNLAPGARVAAIGDSLRTDIAGAQGVGIDGIFIAAGIHGEALGMTGGAPPDQARLAALFEDRGLYPAAALPILRW